MLPKVTNSLKGVWGMLYCNNDDGSTKPDSKARSTPMDTYCPFVVRTSSGFFVWVVLTAGGGFMAVMLGILPPARLLFVPGFRDRRCA